MSNGRLFVDTQEDYDKWIAAQPKMAGAATSFE
jgi:hypothetical protein